MKICIVITGQERLQTAGGRIRYIRLANALKEQGHKVDLTPIGDLVRTTLDADAYIFSKTHDVRAPILAQIMRDKGALVGLDIFDDEYSQGRNSRLVHVRRWLRYLAPKLDFVLYSTPHMATRLSSVLPGIPNHILSDPFDRFDASLLGEVVAEHAARAKSQGFLDIAWFGIASHPRFDVGLHDVHAFGMHLLQARHLGYEPRLHLLTNMKKLTTEQLEMLARLPFKTTIAEWNAEQEKALISRCIACFLPVSAQSFSVVKSLNRAVTSLTNGAQVLSSGFPLYNALEPFVYRDIREMVGDLAVGTLKLRKETTGQLSEALADKADPDTEARELVGFLNSLAGRRQQVPGTQHKDQVVAVIHGARSSGEIHKTIQKLGVFSVASPIFNRRLNFDVTVRLTRDSSKEVDISLSERAFEKVRHDLKYLAVAKPTDAFRKQAA